MLLAVMVILKGEDGEIMYLLPLVNLNSLAIRICVWSESLLALLKEEWKTNRPAFCYMEAYMLSAADIKRVCFLKFWKRFRFTGTENW